MDFKAVISNSGNEKLFKSLSSEIERRLPSASVEWKRSYGRPSKEVVLQANFTKFNPIQLTDDVNSIASFGSKPLLHMFWTSCLDNDGYKSRVRNQILRWQKQLQDTTTTDWLIVHVMYQENSKSGKPKIQLPRTSVFDKIKTEFGQKAQERCLQLWEPDKETLFTKSGESWEVLLMQLRNSLLESFGRQLDNFEDRIRVMREKYANPDWPFLSYFIVHEELALVYQSIMLKEDALVQYDEVDALLSQFIINSSGRALPKWLEQFCKSPSKYDGVVLQKSANEQYRNFIKSGQISLLEFRNYLFARQCKLLIKNKRKWEIPSRLLEFLHTSVHELKLLKIEIPERKIACWIVLTCLHIFQVLESFESKDISFNSTMSQLCDYVRQKLQYLGQITGLYYNRPQTDKELEISTELLSSFGHHANCNKKENFSSRLDILSKALQLKDEYNTFYLDITKKCIDMLKDIKRPHFSIVVGIDLAKFYLQHGQYLDAEPLLEKAWSVYKQQKWQTLYTDVLVPLAGCQLQHELHDRYLNSVTLLSCAQCLPHKTRQYYSNELIRLASNAALKLPTISIEPVIKLLDVKIDLVKNKGHIGDIVKVIVTLQNQLTEELQCRQMSVLSRYCALDNPRSFTDDPISPRKSIFEQTDYGMSISLASAEKLKENNIKEALTPSNLLKRIKSHRRTWSRNKNALENDSKIESSSVSLSSTTSSSTTPPKNISPSHSSQSVGVVKKALFAVGDTDENSLKDPKKGSNVNNDDTKVKRQSLLELSESNSTEPIIVSYNGDNPATVQKKKENGNVVRERSIDEVLKPLATSSLSGEAESVPEIPPMRKTSIDSDRSSQSNLDESSLFVQPEIEEVLDQMLTSKPNITLKPGVNQVELSAKIIHEGRYILQHINCIIDNLTLYKLLALPRNYHSFFMVADPPKITWTSDYLVDYLLTGSKQRLHVTLLNGPGVILEGSILEISSKSGLKFYSLPSSSIQLYPLERDGIPREAAISLHVNTLNDFSIAQLRLPYCKPYERVNIYLDVIAPVHRIAGEQSMKQHEINFSCVWLKDLVNKILRLDCIFYEPFQVKQETFHKMSRIFVKVTLCGVNPVPLEFLSPTLQAVESERKFKMLSSNSELRLFGSEECSLLWLLENQGDNDDALIKCKFTVQFNTKHTDDNDLGRFEQQFDVTTQQIMYSVDTTVGKDVPQKSKPCRMNVKVVKHSSPSTESHRLFLLLNPANITWKYTGRENYVEVLFGGEDYSQFEVLLSTELTGLVALPKFILMESKFVDMSFETNFNDFLEYLPKGSVSYDSYGLVTCVQESISDV